MREITATLSALAGLALSAAGVAAPAVAPSAQRMMGPDARSPMAIVAVGEFRASRPFTGLPLAAGLPVRGYGDTFDCETLAFNTPLSLFTFISSGLGGQSLPYDGIFHLSGPSVFNGFPVESGAAVFPGPPGLQVLSVQSRITPFSDGFLPVGFSFPGGGPVTVLGWTFGAFSPAFNRSGPADSLEPAFSAEFPPSGAFDVVDANVYFLDNGVLLGSGTLPTGPQYNVSHLDMGVQIVNAAGSNIDQLVVEYLVQSAAADTELTLAPVDDCLDASETQLVVEINASGVHGPNVGGQYFLQYDQTRLDFVSAVPGDAPFTREVYEVVNEAAGTIDYATGVPDGDPGTAVPSTMARITFNVLTDICQEDALVTFRTHTPPSRITDDLGMDLGALLVDLGAVTKDSVPPVIVAPADITTNADAGVCTALLDWPEAFDSNPSLCATQTPACWYVDRYAPAAFESAFFDGDNRLLHAISAADSAANRPPAFAGAFYDTQGRKHDVDIPVGQKWSIDLHIPADWGASARRADIWATTFDSWGQVSGFPILGFISNDPADPSNPTPANPTPRFRFYSQDADQDPGNGYAADWIELGLPVGFSYDRWWTLEVELTPTGYEYAVIDDTNAPVISGTDTAGFGSIRAGNVIVQAYNFGQSYEVYWDNAVLGPAGPVATDDCSDVTITYERSDNPALTLADPFPQGVTTVTWTATDHCGNASTDAHTVTVTAFNTLAVDVELQTVDAGPFQRCVTFELVPAGGGSPVVVDHTFTFVGGVASDAVDVPCGDYECITARDALHTLRRTDSDGFAIAGPLYVADFTAAGGGDDLLGGNLNDDAFVDILDFGVFIGQFGSFPGADTPCGTPAPHGDVSGDGDVDTADFTFIQINFFEFHELRCDGSLNRTPPRGRGRLTASAHAPEPEPVLSITAAELGRRGQEHLIEADLNLDGVLDLRDMDAFAAGARPDRLADVNADGTVDLLDLRDVAEAQASGDARGDANRDGGVDFEDLRFVAQRIGASTAR